MSTGPTGEKRPADSRGDPLEEAPCKKSRQDPEADKTHGKVADVVAAADVCTVLGLNVGDRIEVMWDITFEGNELGLGSKDESHGKRTESRWWGANLLPHDGRTRALEAEEGEAASVEAPVRELDYDPYPDGGFPDRSKEDVVFLSKRLVLLSSGGCAHWRREGENWEPSADDDSDQVDANQGLSLEAQVQAGGDSGHITISRPSAEEGIRAVLDAVLHTALGKSGDKMKMLTPAQQAVVAEKIAKTKERLLEKMMEQINSDDEGTDIAKVITPEHVRRCMAEL